MRLSIGLLHFFADMALVLPDVGDHGFSLIYVGVTVSWDLERFVLLLL